MESSRIVLLPGDGVGPEVVGAARGVLEAAGQRFGLGFAFEEAPIGGAAYEACGVSLPPETLALCRRSAAGLFGAVGGPKWDALPRPLRPEQGILSLRRELALFANLRPAKMLDPLAGASSLKAEVVRGVDLLVVREATGGIYFGQPRGVEPCEGGERAFDTMVYTTPEIVRVARLAFELASRRRRRVTSVDKANVLEASALWRRVVGEVARDYPGVELRHMYVDAAAMELIREPRQFDVLVMGNLFGDILSDAAAMLTGSIGMLPSANLDGKGFGIYEPVHGSAPDIAGKDRANPCGAILSGALLLRHSLGAPAAAEAIERAVEGTLAEGYRTADLKVGGGRVVGCREMGERVAAAVAGG